MKKFVDSEKTNPLTMYAVIALLSIFIINSCRNLWTGYSYWFDEIFSVSASKDSWAQLFSKWILPDVHPPLYQVILKLWINAIGDSEIATRTLSFIFAVLAILLMALFTRKSGTFRQLVAIAFLGSSPAFAFYAQETRSYSMLLFLSVIVTGSALILRRDSISLQISRQNTKTFNYFLLSVYYISALVLSLTHYFGWIYVFVISIINFTERLVDSKRIRSLLLIVAISCWPVIHVLYGSILSRSGGNFWIQVTPFFGTIRNLFSGTFPLIEISKSYILLHIFLFILLIVILYLSRSFQGLKTFLLSRSKSLEEHLHELRYLSVIILIFISLIIIIDLNSPISTSRNFIVLLPAVAILFSDIAVAVFASKSPFRRFATVAFVTILVLYQMHLSYQDLSKKTFPKQNWKELAHFVKSSAACENSCSIIWGAPLIEYNELSYYFRNISFKQSIISNSILNSSKKQSAMALNPSVDSYRLEKNDLPLLGFHLSGYFVPQISEANPDSQCWEPPQSSKNEAFIFLPKNSDIKPQSYGLAKCNNGDG
jgi:mannosyltransferase